MTTSSSAAPTSPSNPTNKISNNTSTKSTNGDLDSRQATILYAGTALLGLLWIPVHCIPEWLNLSRGDVNHVHHYHHALLVERLVRIGHVFAVASMLAYYWVNPTLWRHLHWGAFWTSLVLIVLLPAQLWHELRNESLQDVQRTNLIASTVGVAYIQAYNGWLITTTTGTRTANATTATCRSHTTLLHRLVAEPLALYETLCLLVLHTHAVCLGGWAHVLVQHESFAFAVRLAACAGLLILLASATVFHFARHPRAAQDLRSHWRTINVVPKMKFV